jgi:hypothetical protein
MSAADHGLVVGQANGGIRADHVPGDGRSVPLSAAPREHAWLAFGEYDIIAVVELPENTDAAAFSMAVAAAGAVKAFKTTPLLSVEEGVEAMRKAQGAGYRPPSG